MADVKQNLFSQLLEKIIYPEALHLLTLVIMLTKENGDALMTKQYSQDIIKHLLPILGNPERQLRITSFKDMITLYHLLQQIPIEYMISTVILDYLGSPLKENQTVEVLGENYDRIKHHQFSWLPGRITLLHFAASLPHETTVSATIPENLISQILTASSKF